MMEYHEPVNKHAVRAAHEAGVLAGIPWWVYLIVILVGVALTILFATLWLGNRRRAGSFPPGPGMHPASSGTGLLMGAIVSGVLLVLAPLVIMLIAQPWNGSNSRRATSLSGTAGEESNDRAGEKGSNEGGILRTATREAGLRNGGSSGVDLAWLRGDGNHRWQPDCNTTSEYVFFGADSYMTPSNSGSYTLSGDMVSLAPRDGVPRTIQITRVDDDTMLVTSDGRSVPMARCLAT